MSGERTAIRIGAPVPARLRPDACVAQHVRPVPGGAGVCGHGAVEQLGDVVHRLTSFSCFSRFARAACSVADTVPREMPSASAIAA